LVLYMSKGSCADDMEANLQGASVTNRFAHPTQ